MKRERSDDDDVNDARAPGSPPRGLEREENSKIIIIFFGIVGVVYDDDWEKKIFVLSLSKINHVLLRLQNDSDDDDR